MAEEVAISPVKEEHEYRSCLTFAYPDLNVCQMDSIT